MMPDLDGMEFLRRMKRETRFVDIPVIMQTAASSPDQVREGLEAGAEEVRHVGGSIRVGQLVSAMRHADRGLEIAELAVRHRNNGVVGFDIAGAEAGFPAPAHLVHALNSARDHVLADPGLREVYAPNGELLQVGDTVRRPKFAATLRRVAQNGAAEFYLRNYTTASGWVGDLRALGGIVSTPVINHPEVAIVGVNRMVDRPMVRNGAVVVRQMMNLSSSFDHRVVDGMNAAEFVQKIRGYLECPATLFVE